VSAREVGATSQGQAHPHLWRQYGWQTEVEFRGLKQTLNRAELRCRTAERVRVELDWSVLGMAVAELLALKEQLQQKAARQAKAARTKKDRPSRRSLAGTMRALRWCLRNLDQEREEGRSLTDRLGGAVIDDYRRRSSKRARYRPSNPDKKPLGDPKVRVLTDRELTKLRETEANLAA
jgi:hypothetical protein